MHSELPKQSFISANTEHGFFSLYENVFQNQDFNKIFVILGGPGTGKSTLMRKLAEKAKEKEIDVKELLCSSDADSLDGVILSKNGKRVGVLDGTPPHARIVTAPGTTEEIWHLGAFWDTKILQSALGEIKAAEEKKKCAYKEAYAFLSAAGICHEIGKRHLLTRLDTEKMRAQIMHKIKKAKGNGESTKCLFRAFSMKGEVLLRETQTDYENVVLLSGKKQSAEIYLSIMKEVLEQNKVASTIFLSPLSEESIDAIYLDEAKTLYSWEGFFGGEKAKKKLHLSRFLIPEKTVDHALLHASDKQEKMLKRLALSSLLHAAEAHFSLEDIYRSAVDFDALDRKGEEWVRDALSALTD